MADTPANSLGAVLHVHRRTPARSAAHELPDSPGDEPRGIVLPDGTTAFVVMEDKHFARTTSTPARSAIPGPPSIRRTAILQKLISSADGRFLVELASGPIASRPTSGCTTRRATNSSPDRSTFLYPSTTRPSARTEHGCTCQVARTATSSRTRFRTATCRSSRWFPRLRLDFEWTTAGLAFVEGDLLAVGSTTGPVRLVDPHHARRCRLASVPAGEIGRAHGIRRRQEPYR